MKPIVNKLTSPHSAIAYGVLALYATLTTALPAQTYTRLHSFNSHYGANPAAGLVQALNGDLYGTTVNGGASGNPYGTLFRITPAGAFTSLYSFCSLSGCTDGDSPSAGLLQATNGDLYGTTQTGGTNLNASGNGAGTIFRITPGGVLTTVYDFCALSGCADGDAPQAGLIEGTNGDFYGTTYEGGANCAPNGCGTVFKITPSGTLTTLYSFCSVSGCTDGEYPQAGLVQATNGDFYGTTVGGGAHGNYGTVFKITPTGTLTTLYSFCAVSGCADGSLPFAGLVQATNGYLYGTTGGGGAAGQGTVYKITPSGAQTTIYNFCSLSGCVDGIEPMAALIQATNGDLGGTTYTGGANGGGTIFRITPSGTLTTLYSFCALTNCADGANPEAPVAQDTDGVFYGTTFSGGAYSAGAVYSLSVGLGPFVETLPTSGAVGSAVKILGTNLTGATSVNFNGTAAVFTVVSSSEITTTVPAGATTGTVQVVASGTLSSNVPFRVP
ncbi:MAG: choice-of-anchor tandem repeat GloVer-containing protein [Bryobacteraceae bacterium]